MWQFLHYNSFPGLGEGAQLAPQLLRVNEDIRDRLSEAVEALRGMASAQEATTRALQEVVQQQQEFMQQQQRQSEAFLAGLRDMIQAATEAMIVNFRGGVSQ